VCAESVPKMLTFSLEAEHVAASTEHLHRFELEGNIFLQRIVTCDETWVRSSMEWSHKGYTPPSKFKTQLSADKVMASVFWDSEGVIHIAISSTWCKN
jgi:hypothetical protein